MSRPWVPHQPGARSGGRSRHALAALGSHASELSDVQITRPSLEAAYLAITGAHPLADEGVGDVAAA